MTSHSFAEYITAAHMSQGLTLSWITGSVTSRDTEFSLFHLFQAYPNFLSSYGYYAQGCIGQTVIRAWSFIMKPLSSQVNNLGIRFPTLMIFLGLVFDPPNQPTNHFASVQRGIILVHAERRCFLSSFL